MRRPESTTLKRYWLFQIPGLAAVAALAWAATNWFGVPPWAGLAALLAWLVKDAALYPLLKSAYQGSAVSGFESMVGMEGTVIEALDPRGLVKIGPEIWKAESASALPRGCAVRVVGSSGMTMIVQPEPAAEAPAGTAIGQGSALDGA